MGLPSGAVARAPWPRLFRRENGFFEALVRAAQEAPDRPVTNRDPVRQAPLPDAQGDIRTPRDMRKQPGPVLSRSARRPMPAHLAGRNTAGPALALPQFAAPI